MKTPATIHTPNRIQVTTVRLTISQTHAHAEAIGSSGTIGARNPRGRSGRLRRRTMTPADTSRNANNVPTLTISSSLSVGNAEAVAATSNATSTVMRTGVAGEPVLASLRRH